MDSKFEEELDKIDQLLAKVEKDLSTDHETLDFQTFFRNLDKTFEIYNICLEELCGQLYLLELGQHSKVYRKLYHQYKLQLYNIMKQQLAMQKEAAQKTENEKNLKAQIESLSQKQSKTKEKLLDQININDELQSKMGKLQMSINLQNEKIKKLTLRQQRKSIDDEERVQRKDSEKQMDYMMNMQRLKKTVTGEGLLDNERIDQEKNNLLLGNIDVMNNPLVKLQIEELIEQNRQLKESMLAQKKAFQEQIMNQAMKGVNFREKIEKGMLTEGTFYSFQEHENLKNALSNA